MANRLTNFTTQRLKEEKQALVETIVGECTDSGQVFTKISAVQVQAKFGVPLKTVFRDIGDLRKEVGASSNNELRTV